MPRPIIMTEQMKQSAMDDFTALLKDMKMSDGSLNYSKSFKYKDKSAVVWLTQEAYRKILALVLGFNSEVGWHGIASRSGDNEFTIEDIIVYPQEVTGSTVNTDQELYTDWLYSLDDETFNKVRMQGHSHVNMGVSPSGVDNTHRQQIIEQLDSGMFYIFMIWNKSLSIHTLIYDMQHNVLYEDKDVEIYLLDNADMDEFMIDAVGKVQKRGQRKKETVSKTKCTEQELSPDDVAELEQYMQFGLYDQYDLGGSAWTL